jgi:uncharacterized protein
MKYLLIIVVVLLVIWILRSQRRREPPPEAPRGSPSTTGEPMLACLHCGLHLPRNEALPGRGGVFCGEAHRAEYEKAHPLP